MWYMCSLPQKTAVDKSNLLFKFALSQLLQNLFCYSWSFSDSQYVPPSKHNLYCCWFTKVFVFRQRNRLHLFWTSSSNLWSWPWNETWFHLRYCLSTYSWTFIVWLTVKSACDLSVSSRVKHTIYLREKNGANLCSLWLQCFESLRKPYPESKMITRKSNSERHIDEQMSQFLICRVYFPIALILSQASCRVNSPNQISSFSLNHMSFRKIHRWIITWKRMYHLWNYLIFRVTNRVSPPWYWNGANLLFLT